MLTSAGVPSVTRTRAKTSGFTIFQMGNFGMKISKTQSQSKYVPGELCLSLEKNVDTDCVILSSLANSFAFNQNHGLVIC